MHDPMTVAFEIKSPFRSRPSEHWPDGYRETWVTVWHVDPERGGDDNSCDWFNRGKAEDRADPRRTAVYEALWDVETLLDNPPHYPDSPEHRAFQPLKTAVRAALAPPPRPWYRHPRWHVHHWRLQVHPLQALRRRLFTRCEVCGRGFRGESAVGRHWDDPPRRWFEWFRGERGLRHDLCNFAASRPAPAAGLGGVPAVRHEGEDDR